MENDIGLGRKKATEPISEQIYKQLKEMILTFQLKPGQILVDSQLSEMFSVSRTPVREALIRLTYEGLVAIENGRSFVMRLTFDEIIEIYIVRESLEGMAARLASEKMTEEKLDKLRKIQEIIRNALIAKDYPQLFTADNDFHHQMAVFSGNRLILDTLSRFYMQISRIRYLGLLFNGRTEATYLEHIDILQALEDGDPDYAENSARAHVVAARKALEEFMKNYEEAALMDLSLTSFLKNEE